MNYKIAQLDNTEKRIPNSNEPESVSERIAKEEIRKLNENIQEIERLREALKEKR